ncbi:hypothetical protein JYT91_01535, partial [archaeon AH-315-M20]|nr:hypothetical protein [archaeon AH-315-M20]
GGFILNLENAFDGSLNDTTTNTTITSNDTGIGNFSHVNLTFQINESLDTARIFFITAKNASDIPGSIYIYNFTSSKFEFFFAPSNTSAQVNQTIVSTASGQINSTGHVIVFANATANGSNSSTLHLLDIYVSSNTFDSCGPVTNTVGGNAYDCTFDTTGKTVGNYNVTMIGSKDFHHSGTISNGSAFKITSTPTLKNASVAIEAEGWGRLRNFSVNVTDNAGDTVTVIAWEDIGSGFVQIGNQTCTSCSDTVLTFTSSYTCTGNIGDGKKFKFNATDTEGNSDETTVAARDYNSDDEFEIEKDNVNLTLISGNGSNATLLTAAILKLRVFDIDNNTFILTNDATVTFNVTKRGVGANFSTEGTATTNEEGFANFSFTPDRSFIRDVQDWRGFIDDTESCYKVNESRRFNLTTFTNVPQLTNESVTPKSGGWGIERFFNITVNDTHNNATISLFESSAVDGVYTLLPLGEKNYSHAEEVNKTIHDASTTPDSSFNYTEEINFTAFNISLFNITVNNRDLFNITFNLTVNEVFVAVNQNVTNGTNTTVDVLPNVSIIFPGNNTINITIMNSSTGNATDTKYIVYLNYRLTGTVRTLIFSINLTRDHDVGTTDAGITYFFKFNATNTVLNRNETELLTANNFTVTKDTLIFENITGNNSVANRTSEQIDLLLVRVFDQDNGTYVGNINVTFSVTTDGSAFDSGFKNLTNVSGFARSEFDPTCVSPKYEVGNQTWKMEIKDEDKYFDLTQGNLNLTTQGDIGL